MIKLLIYIAFIIIPAPAFCQELQKAQPNGHPADSMSAIPVPAGYMNDFGHVFNDMQKKTLDSLLASFDAVAGIQIVFVTLDTNMTTADNFDSYTHRIATTWDVGQKDKNNGIVVAIGNRYRRIRIETGYGIQPLLTDTEAKGIVDNVFIPRFKSHKLYEGTFEGLQAIINKLQQNKKRSPKMFKD